MEIILIGIVIGIAAFLYGKRSSQKEAVSMFIGIGLFQEQLRERVSQLGGRVTDPKHTMKLLTELIVLVLGKANQQDRFSTAGMNRQEEFHAICLTIDLANAVNLANPKLQIPWQEACAESAIELLSDRYNPEGARAIFNSALFLLRTLNEQRRSAIIDGQRLREWLDEGGKSLNRFIQSGNFNDLRPMRAMFELRSKNPFLTLPNSLLPDVRPHATVTQPMGVFEPEQEVAINQTRSTEPTGGSFSKGTEIEVSEKRPDETSSFNIWYAKFKLAAASANPSLLNGDIIDFLDHGPLKLAFRDNVDPEWLGQKYGSQFDFQAILRANGVSAPKP
jgi:hypothetical protein